MGEIGRYNSMLVILLNHLGDICGDDNAYMNLLDRRIPADLLDRPDRSPLSLPSDPELCTRTAAAEHVRSVERVLLYDSHISATGLILVSTLNLTYKALPADDPLRGWIQAMYRHCNGSNGAGQKLPVEDKDPYAIVPQSSQWKRFCFPMGDDWEIQGGGLESDWVALKGN